MRIREILIGVAAALVIILLWYQPSFIPIVVLACLFFLLFRFSGFKTPRFNTVGKSLCKRKPVDFNQIGGQEVAKKELLEALDFLLKPQQIRRMGIRPLKGIMLVGPPGTGKTLLAKAAAGYTQSSFLSVAGSEFIEMYAGVGAQRVRRLFADCRTKARQ
jgi:cell division protease FtsH